jgi:hypothetical protein
MPTPRGYETRAERAAREAAGKLEPTARIELSAMLMTRRLDKALALANVDPTTADDAKVMRVLAMEALGLYYKARAEGGPRENDVALRSLAEARKALMSHAEMIGAVGPKVAPPAASGVEAGPAGEKIAELMRYVLATDRRFERAYRAAVAGKPFREFLEAPTTIEGEIVVEKSHV